MEPSMGRSFRVNRFSQRPRHSPVEGILPEFLRFGNTMVLWLSHKAASSVDLEFVPARNPLLIRMVDERGLKFAVDCTTRLHAFILDRQKAGDSIDLNLAIGTIDSSI